MKTTRRLILVVTVAVGAAVGNAWGFGAREVKGHGRVDVQSFAALGRATSPGSEGWRPLQGSTLRLPCPAGRAASATMSLVLAPGGPARIRVEAIDRGVSGPSGPGKRVGLPGAVPVARSGRSRTVSFTSVFGRLPGSHGVVVRIAARSEGDLEVRKGSLRVLWDRSSEPCR